MPSHNDTAHSRAHAINILSARLGANRKLLTGDIAIDHEGPSANFFDPNGSDRTVTLPAISSKEASLYFISNIGTANSLSVVSANALAVATIAFGETAVILSSGAEWVALKANATTLDVFGAAGPNHKVGLVPDPGAVVGATRILVEDGTWKTITAAGIVDAFKFITDGTNTATGTGFDTFRLRSSDGSVTITVTNNDVTYGDVANFVVNPANVNHNALLNYVADEHVAHSGVSINTAANSGLVGGGTIAASRSLSIDASNLTVDTPVLADSFIFYDTSGSDTNRATLTTLNGILDHNALLNYSANRHIDHTSVSIQAGTALSGGGDISATRTLNVDINGLTVDTPASADYCMFYDVSGGDTNKATWANINAIFDHNTLVNYDANRHIDHTAVSINTTAPLAGGGTIAATRTLTLNTDGVDNTFLANMATQTFKGRTTAGTGDPEDLTATQATAILNTFTQTLKGLVPAPVTLANKLLRDDGTWVAAGAGDFVGPASSTDTALVLFDGTTGKLGKDSTVKLSATVLAPVSNDGVALGSTALMWSDLFLASGAVVNFNNGNVTITHAAGSLTVAGADLSLGTSAKFTTGTIELGAASDCTLSRAAAGQIAVEGVNVPTISSTDTLTNKRVTPRVTATSGPGATPTINTDNCDFVDLSALATAITSMSTNLSGTPTNGQKLIIRFKDNGTARAITWGASFEACGVALPTTTVISKRLTVGFLYDTGTSKWGCVASVQEA